MENEVKANQEVGERDKGEKSPFYYTSNQIQLDDEELRIVDPGAWALRQKSKEAKELESKQAAEQVEKQKAEEVKNPKPKDEEAGAEKLKDEGEGKPEEVKDVLRDRLMDKKPEPKAAEVPKPEKQIDPEKEKMKVELEMRNLSDSLVELRETMTKPEWEIIENDIAELIKSPKFDALQKAGMTMPEISATLVATAKGLKIKELSEYMNKKAMEKAKIKTEEEIKANFKIKQEKANTVLPQAKIDALKKEALKGNQDALMALINVDAELEELTR